MASQRDLAKQLLQRAGDDEAAAKAVLSIETALRWATAAVTWARAQLEAAAEPLVADSEGVG